MFTVSYDLYSNLIHTEPQPPQEIIITVWYLTFLDHFGWMFNHLYIIPLMQCIGCPTKLMRLLMAYGWSFLQTYNFLCQPLQFTIYGNTQ